MRDEKLYVSRHSSFEEYCKERWGIGLRHARRLIAAVKISKNLSLLAEAEGAEGYGYLPSSEKVLRPLSPLEPPLQAAVWRLATRVNPHPTSQIVSRIVGVVRRAIDQSTEGNNGAMTPPRQTPHSYAKFLSSLHQLAESRLSPYRCVELLNEVAARKLFTSCQRVIVQAHEFIEAIRTRFPAI